MVVRADWAREDSVGWVQSVVGEVGSGVGHDAFGAPGSFFNGFCNNGEHDMGSWQDQGSSDRLLRSELQSEHVCLVWASEVCAAGPVVRGFL